MILWGPVNRSEHGGTPAARPAALCVPYETNKKSLYKIGR